MSRIKYVKVKDTPFGEFWTYGKSKIRVLHSIDGGKHHISLSYANKLPSYEEMKEARYQICPDVGYMAQIFPPKNEFVNLHEYTLQIWEL